MTVSGRGNGLQAAGYAFVAALDPRLADAMLEILRDAGVAAYAVPSTGDLGAALEVYPPPDGPTDRLYADRSAIERVRRIMEQRLPGLREGLTASLPGSTHGTDPDTEAAWQDIVAAYDAPSTEVLPPWPVAEDVDENGDDDAPPPSPRESSPRDDDADHFVPPPPPPLPTTDAITKAAWAALLGGPLLLLLGTLLGWELEGRMAFLATAAFVTGFVTLLVRMGDRPPTDSGPDDGAVV